MRLSSEELGNRLQTPTLIGCIFLMNPLGYSVLPPHLARLSCDQLSLELSSFFQTPVKQRGLCCLRLAVFSYEMILESLTACRFQQSLELYTELIVRFSFRGFFHSADTALSRLALCSACVQPSLRLWHGFSSCRKPGPPPFCNAYAARGSERRRSPVRANRALATAGANGGTPGSPTPPGGSWLGTSHVSTTGARASFTSG